MAVIKTGAVISFMNYGVIAPADIHKIANALVIRLGAPLHDYHEINRSNPYKGPPTHELLIGMEVWHDMLMTTTIVVPEESLKEL